MKRVPVLEIFGPTIQGEGMVVGQKTMFVRTAGCDYRCAWCDSAFTWDGSGKDRIQLLTAEDIWHELEALGQDRFSHVTISGGNPGLLAQLDELVELLHARGMQVALETQGSKWQDWFLAIDQLTISPKPPSSQMDTNFHVLDDVLTRLASHKGVSLKVVVFDEADLKYAEKVHVRYPTVPFYLQAGNAWLEDAPTELLPKLVARYEWLIDQVNASNTFVNVRVLPQLHTYVWGNKAGV